VKLKSDKGLGSQKARSLSLSLWYLTG